MYIMVLHLGSFDSVTTEHWLCAEDINDCVGIVNYVKDRMSYSFGRTFSHVKNVIFYVLVMLVVFTHNGSSIYASRLNTVEVSS